MPAIILCPRFLDVVQTSCQHSAAPSAWFRPQHCILLPPGTSPEQAASHRALQHSASLLTGHDDLSRMQLSPQVTEIGCDVRGCQADPQQQSLRPHRTSKDVFNHMALCQRPQASAACRPVSRCKLRHKAASTERAVHLKSAPQRQEFIWRALKGLPARYRAGQIAKQGSVLPAGLWQPCF